MCGHMWPEVEDWCLPQSFINFVIPDSLSVNLKLAVWTRLPGQGFPVSMPPPHDHQLSVGVTDLPPALVLGVFWGSHAASVTH